MTSRERRMLLFLSVFGLLFAGYAAYALVWAPIQANRQRANDIQAELSDQEAALDLIAAGRKRLDAAKKRSLPANPDDARREYEAAIRKLLLDAKVPPGYTISQKDNSNIQTIPELEPKKPAYQRIGYSIQLKKVNLPTVAKFLEAYYGLNLLHRITEFNLKKDESQSGDSSRPGAKFDLMQGRDNLDVTLVTEAIILDGAEERKTLLTVPTAVAAIGGGAGRHAVAMTPVVGRGLAPVHRAQVLSTSKRDYALLAAKDVYNGPLPKYPDPPKPKEDVALDTPPPPPKDDISEYIKLVDITRRSDGTAEAQIRDNINNQDYQIDLRPRAERLEVKVQKYLYVAGSRKRTEILDEERSLTYLVIREEDTSTDRRFKVAGLEADGLVLVETVELTPKAKPEPKKEPSRGPSRGPGGTREVKKLDKSLLPAAVVGGIGAVPPPPTPVYEDRVFVWRVGQTLDLLKSPLTKDAAAELLKKVGYELPATVPASLTSGR